MVVLFVFLLMATAATALFAWRAFRYEPSTPVATVVTPEIEAAAAAEESVSGSAPEPQEAVEAPVAQSGGQPSMPAPIVDAPASRPSAPKPPAAQSNPQPSAPAPSPPTSNAPAMTTKAPTVAAAPSEPAPQPTQVEPPKAEPAPPPPPKRSNKIMLGGTQAYDPPPAPKPSPKKVAVAAPVVKQTPTRGDLYWTGELKKKQVITINGIDSTAGLPGGDFLPGKPVTLEVYSPAIRVIEEPNEANGWTKISFECLRSSKGSATINFRWKLR